jgi:hypothetical protein
MATLLRPTRSVNSANLAAVAWHALLKTADREAVRDDLSAGTAHTIDLAVSGTVDGEEFFEHIVGQLSVGHDSQRASSANPPLDKLIGYILSQLNESHRNAILRLPALYAEQGCELPEVSPAIAAETDAFLKKFRAAKTAKVRGSVSFKRCPVDSDSAAFSVVG